MANAKKKGNIWENKLANWLRSHGFKATKDPSSGSHSERGDIVNEMNLTIESKSCKTVKLMEWWKQVDYAASQQKNEPALFIHVDGMRDNEWLVVMHSEDWIEHMKKDEQVENTYQDPKAKWALQNAREALRVAIKYLE
jgi:Holliday junction resolvase